MTFRPGIKYTGGSRCSGVQDIINRKTREFSPLDIFGCSLWVDAGQLVGLSNNDKVALWSDQSGNGNNLIQATAIYKPVYKTNIQNGLPALLFSIQFMTSDAGMSPILSGEMLPFSAFIVTTFDDPTSGRRTLISWGHSGVEEYAELYLQSENSIYNLSMLDNEEDEIYIEGEIDLDTEWRIAEIVSTGEVVSMWDTGIADVADQDITDIDDSTNIDMFTIGCRRYESTLADPFKGYIAEALVYDTALSSVNRLLVESYLISKYGLS